MLRHSKVHNGERRNMGLKLRALDGLVGHTWLLDFGDMKDDSDL
jgi:hypothetical protein